MNDKIPLAMRSKIVKSTLITINILVNLVAQGVLFAPAVFAKTLSQLPVQNNNIIGSSLLAITFIVYLFLLRAISNRSWIKWILLLIHLVTLAGVEYLTMISDSDIGLAGFMFSAAISMLTALGLIANLLSTDGKEELVVSSTEDQGIATNTPAEPIRYIESHSQALNEQINSLSRKLNAEKQRNTQLSYLNELSHQLESELDQPVAGQLTVNMLDRALACSLVSLMLYEQETKEFVALATVGRDASVIPPGYRQSADLGLLGRIARLKKTQLINDTSIDPDFFPVNDEQTLSEIIVPIIHNAQLKGVIEVCANKTFAYNHADVGIVENAASELMRAWERSSYDRRISRLIESSITLATQPDPQAAVQEVAKLARTILEARFVFISILDQQGNFSRTASAGDAQELLNSLNESPTREPLLQVALNATKPFRIRDIRKYANTKKIEIDHGGLRSTLIIPIRLHGLSIGAIIAFGKQEGVFFSEKDESIADLLSSQAAAAIESSWLYQELRSTLSTTSLLYQLSLDVTQIEDLNKAVGLIAQTARRTTNAKEAGIVLLSKDDKIEAAVEVDENGFHERDSHPLPTINQAIQSRQAIFVSSADSSIVCYPLITRARAIGALWMDIPESRGQNFANLQTLANQAAVTLERTLLLAESRRQAKEIEAAYEQLQATYDQTLSALMSALDARDRETEGHSNRVSRTACMIGELLGLNGIELKALERGSLLHDIGKIGISDTILHKPGKLTDEEWKIMKTHPSIGAKIVAGIPFLQECMPVVYGHHERWDGSGYPQGLKATDIHINARIFAVADVFDALTSKRAYRKSSTADEALQYLREQSNILFDEQVVEKLSQLPYNELIQPQTIAA